jgi:hypothetical protein
MKSVSKEKLLKTKLSLIEAVKSLSKGHRFGQNRSEDQYFKDIFIASTLYETYLNGFLAAIEANVFKQSESDQALKVIFIAEQLCTDIKNYRKEQ